MFKRQCGRVALFFTIVMGIGLFACPLVAQAASPGRAPKSIGDIAAASVEPAGWELPDQSAPQQSDEPFGRRASGLVKGGLQDLWHSASQKLAGEHRILVACRANAKDCPAPAARFLAVIDRAAEDEGWMRIAEINRAINLDIRPVSDIAQYGSANVWPTPLMAFTSNAGDCKDYAIAKFVALEELGIAADDLRLIVVRIRDTGEYHAVAAARFDGRWLILDNRTSDMRSDVDVADYDPLFVIDGDNVRRMIVAPPEPQVAERAPAPVTVNPMLFAGPENFLDVG